MDILTTGGSLTASAVALDGAAAALTSAAGVLGGKGVLDAVPGGKAAKAGSSIWGKAAAVMPLLGAFGVGTGIYYAAEGAKEAYGTGLPGDKGGGQTSVSVSGEVHG